MHILLVHNSTCQIQNLRRDHFDQLRNLLCFEVDSGQSKTIYSTSNGVTQRKVIRLTQKKYLMNAKGFFPTGLLYKVVDFLVSHSLPYEEIDVREKPKLHSNPNINLDWNNDGTIDLGRGMRVTPHQWQIDASKAALLNNRGVICATTGSGKSIGIVLTLDLFKVKTLIVVPSLALKSQLTQTLQEFFGKKAVGPMVKRHAKFPITVENVDALKVTDSVKGVDMLIIDEVHRSGAEGYRELNKILFKDIYFKFGFTATNFRSQPNELILLESVLSNEIYKLDYQEAHKAGFIVPLEVFTLDFKRDKVHPKYSNYHNAYSELVVKNESRNRMIVDLIKGLHLEGTSTLVLCKQIEHGETLRDMLALEGIDVPFAEGKSLVRDQDIEDFNNLKERTLIGTTGVLGEGIDSRPTEYVIIVGCGKAKVQLAQNIGRVLRRFEGKKSGRVILINDIGAQFIGEHYLQCVKHIKDQYDLKPTEWKGIPTD